MVATTRDIPVSRIIVQITLDNLSLSFRRRACAVTDYASGIPQDGDHYTFKFNDSSYALIFCTTSLILWFPQNSLTTAHSC